MPMHDWTQVGAGTYHDFHLTWITALKIRLNELLPTRYCALAEQRTAGPVPDDVALSTSDSDDVASEWVPPAGGIAVAEVRPKARVVDEVTEDVYLAKQNHIAIRTAEGDRLVAIVELVSPGNRGADWPLRSFVDKCRQMIKRGIHLLIVDPFPPDIRAPHGLHALIFEEFSRTPAGVTADKPLSQIAYECRDGVRAYLERLAIGDSLADMPVFLHPADGFIEVPLEETYTAAWKAMPLRWRTVLDGGDAGHAP